MVGYGIPSAALSAGLKSPIRSLGSGTVAMRVIAV